MIDYFVLNSEAEAEAFCTQRCPIYGRDLDGKEVTDKGVTHRLAGWIKHPSLEKWLVKVADMPDGTEGKIEQFEESVVCKKRVLPC